MTQNENDSFITFNIIGICSVIFILSNYYYGTVIFNEMFDILVPESILIWYGSYWGLVTSAFVHIDGLHFLFNMGCTYLFSRMFEKKLRQVYFILFIITSAIVCSSMQIAFSGQTGIGFSGVLYAMFGFAWMARHIESDFYEIAHKQTIQLFMFWLVFCILLTNANIMNIGNAAHVSGLIFGICVGNVFVRKKYEWQSRAVLVLLTSLSIITVCFLPYINIFKIGMYVNSGNAFAQMRYSEILKEKGLFKESMYWLKQSAEQDYLPAMNNLAWAYATSQNENFRHGDEAVRLAEKACERSGWTDPMIIDTLAAAYAEVERWEDAISTQEKAIALLEKNKNDYSFNYGEDYEDPEITDYQSQLEKFRNQEKIRY